MDKQLDITFNQDSLVIHSENKKQQFNGMFSEKNQWGSVSFAQNDEVFFGILFTYMSLSSFTMIGNEGGYYVFLHGKQW